MCDPISKIKTGTASTNAMIKSRLSNRASSAFFSAIVGCCCVAMVALYPAFLTAAINSCVFEAGA